MSRVAEWSPYTTYIVGDVVNYIGIRYTATAVNRNVPPLPATPIWVGVPPSTGVNVSLSGSNTTMYPTFVSATSGTLPVLVDGDFTYNPALGDLSVNQTLKVQSQTSGGRVGIGYFAGNASQSAGAVAIGDRGGQTSQGLNAVSVGALAGNSAQGNYAVAVGNTAGSVSQGTNAVAVGVGAGLTSQGTQAIAIGQQAGENTQSNTSIAIGTTAGQTTQGLNSIAIGSLAGQTNQGGASVALGRRAGLLNQGTNAVAIGNLAGNSNQHANSIVINASGSALDSDGTSRLFVKPVRNASASDVMYYNSTSGEVSYSSAPIPSSITVSATSTNASFYPIFANATSGSVPANVDTTLTYNPSTDTLTCANVSGNASSASNGTTQPNTSNDTSLATTAFVQNKRTATTITGTNQVDTSTEVCILTGTNHTLPAGSYAGQKLTLLCGENPFVYPPINANYNQISTSVPLDVAHYGGIVYVAMANNTSVNNVANTNGIAQYDIATATWSAMGTGATGGGVNRIVISPTGVVYALGSFTGMGGVANTSRIAKWSGGVWSAIGTGLNGDGWDLVFDATDETKFWVVGAFSLAGGVANTSRVAYWDGANYVALGTGANAGIIFSATQETNDILYFSGTFGSFNGVANTANVVKWTVSTATASSIATTVAGIGSNQSTVYWDSTTSSVLLGGVSSVNSNTDLVGIAQYTPSTGLWTNIGANSFSSASVKTIRRVGGSLYVLCGSTVTVSVGFPSSGVSYNLLNSNGSFLVLNPTTNQWAPRFFTISSAGGFGVDANGNFWLGYGSSGLNRMWGINPNKVNVVNSSAGFFGDVGAMIYTNESSLIPYQRNKYSCIIFGQQDGSANLVWSGSKWIVLSYYGCLLSYLTPSP